MIDSCILHNMKLSLRTLLIVPFVLQVVGNILNPAWLSPIQKGECHRAYGSAMPTPLQVDCLGIEVMRFGFGITSLVGYLSYCSGQ